jgi:hypothetical protein
VKDNIDEVELEFIPAVSSQVVAEAEAQDGERAVALVALPVGEGLPPEVVLWKNSE